MEITRVNALEVVEDLKKALEGMLRSSTVNNVTVSTVVQTLEKFAGIIKEEERVAQNVFATVNNLLEIEKRPLRKVKKEVTQQLGKYTRNIKILVLEYTKIKLSWKHPRETL